MFGGGATGLGLDIHFQLVEAIKSLSLINAKSDGFLFDLRLAHENDGVLLFNRLDLGDLPIGLNIQALSTQDNDVGSVKFVLFDLVSGEQTIRIENRPPFALFGDNEGDFNEGTFNLDDAPFGSKDFILTATPYSGKDASGTVGNPATALLLIFNSSLAPGTNAISSQARVYPNPVGNQLTLDLSQIPSKKARATLLDTPARSSYSLIWILLLKIIYTNGRWNPG
ncbi:MAG: hypothetical protein HC880_17015 [Bacteroidia bacterium]|nr:hypothetical protein [Bacteroidia bacterium]